MCSTLGEPVLAGRTGPSARCAVLATGTTVGVVVVTGVARIISVSPLPLPFALVLAVLLPARLSLLQKKPVP